MVDDESTAVATGHDEDACRRAAVVDQEAGGAGREAGCGQTEQERGELPGIENEDAPPVRRERVCGRGSEGLDRAVERVRRRVDASVQALPAPTLRVEGRVGDDEIEGPRGEGPVPDVSPRDGETVIREHRVASGLIAGHGIALEAEPGTEGRVHLRQRDEQSAAPRAQIEDPVSRTGRGEAGEVERPRAGLEPAPAPDQEPLAECDDALLPADGHTEGLGAGGAFTGGHGEFARIPTCGDDGPMSFSVKLAPAALVCFVSTTATARADDGGTRFSLGAGFLVPTLLSVDDELVAASPGPLLLIAFDRPVAPDSTLDWGGFLDVGSFNAGASHEQVNLMQIGGALFWRRPETWGGLLRLGGRFGYRQLFADARGFDSVHGVVVDLVGQFHRPLNDAIGGLLEVGVLTEPIGFNEHGRLSFGPFPYLAVGVVF